MWGWQKKPYGPSREAATRLSDGPDKGLGDRRREGSYEEWAKEHRGRKAEDAGSLPEGPDAGGRREITVVPWGRDADGHRRWIAEEHTKGRAGGSDFAEGAGPEALTPAEAWATREAPRGRLKGPDGDDGSEGGGHPPPTPGDAYAGNPDWLGNIGDPVPEGEGSGVFDGQGNELTHKQLFVHLFSRRGWDPVYDENEPDRLIGWRFRPLEGLNLQTEELAEKGVFKPLPESLGSLEPDFDPAGTALHAAVMTWNAWATAHGEAPKALQLRALSITDPSLVSDFSAGPCYTQAFVLMSQTPSPDGPTRIGLHLQGANLPGATLQGAYLWDATLQGADLTDATLQGANLWCANLQGANLWRANLQGANLTDATLQGAYLWDATLQGADLWDATLQGADLRRANLQGADLSDATLQGADLTDATLQGANLWDATLQGAYLTGAKLQGADLRGAKLSLLPLADLESTEDGVYQNVLLDQDDNLWLVASTEMPKTLRKPWGGPVFDDEDEDQNILSSRRLLGSLRFRRRGRGKLKAANDAEFAVNPNPNEFFFATNLTGAELGPLETFEETVDEDETVPEPGNKKEALELTGTRRPTNLENADIRGAIFQDADLAEAKMTGVIYEPGNDFMQGCFKGTRGLDTIAGAPVFQRDAKDQAYIEDLSDRIHASKPEGGVMTRFRQGLGLIATVGGAVVALSLWLLASVLSDGRPSGASPLYPLWSLGVAALGATLGTWLNSWYGRWLGLKLWSAFDYGRDWDRVLLFAALMIFLFGGFYAVLDQPVPILDGPHIAYIDGDGGNVGVDNWFRPWFVATLGFATLGLSDVVKPLTGLGQLVMLLNVLAGFVTLGLLLAVLGNTFARRAA